jgi:hypothetical protein
VYGQGDKKYETQLKNWNTYIVSIFRKLFTTLTVNIMVLEDVVKYVIIEAHECASGFPFYSLISINAVQLQWEWYKDCNDFRVVGCTSCTYFDLLGQCSVRWMKLCHQSQMLVVFSQLPKKIKFWIEVSQFYIFLTTCYVKVIFCALCCS